MSKVRLLYLFIIWISISSASIFVVLSGAPGSVCAFWRLLLSSIILLPLWFKRGGSISIYCLLSGYFLGFHFILWMESLYLIPIVISTVLVVTYPFYNMLIDSLVFKERISYRQVIALITGFISMLGFYIQDISGHIDIIGVMYASAAGLLAALYFSIGRYLRSRRYQSTIEYVFPTYFSAAIFVLLYNVLLGIDLVNYNVSTYLYFALLAAVPMLGGHTLMNYLLGKMKTFTITSIAVAEPVGAGILAYVIFGQTITIVQLILSFMILSSIMLVFRYNE